LFRISSVHPGVADVTLVDERSRMFVCVVEVVVLLICPASVASVPALWLPG
jgi:hypothetical protein